METDGPPLLFTDFASAPLEQISLQLDFQQRFLDRMHAHMESTLETTQQTDVLSKLMRRTAYEHRKLADALLGPIEELAWRSRNLFELGLIVRYVVSDPSNLQCWLAQKPQDLKEIMEGFIRLHGDQAPETPAWRTIISILEAQAAAQGLPVARRISAAALADLAGIRGEYDAYFKLSSKFIHPTSWLVNEAEEAVDNPLFRRLFVLLASMHAMEIPWHIAPHVGLVDEDSIRAIDDLAGWLNRKR